MSELAFDLNGEPIVFPAEAEELRVRRFRNPGMRGACEVVHDRDGAPLYVPVDTSYVDFRRVVDAAPGRYRLDPCDTTRRVIANSTPAYITIAEAPRNSASTGSGDDRDSVIRELARANADMAKTIADRFANVMQAAADLLRAADGAGLPRREPPPVPAAIETDDDDDDLDDDLEEEDESPDMGSLIAQVLPMIQMWLASKAAEKSAAATPAAAPASAPVPAPAPAPAAAPSSATGEAGAAAGPGGGDGSAAIDVPSGAMPAAASGSLPTTGSPPRSVGDGALAGAARAAMGTHVPEGATVRNAGLPTAAQAAHLMAIYARLAPDEKRVAELVVMRMTPEVREQWLGELSALTVEQAVELVRSMIPRVPSRKESDS